MSINFSTNISDIIKGFIGITLVILAVIFIPKFMDKFEDLGNLNVPDVNIKLDKTTIEEVASGVVKVHLAESEKEFKALLKDLKKENNKAILKALEGQNVKIKELADIMAAMKSSIDTKPDIDVIYGAKEDPRRLESFMVYRTDADGNKYPTGIVYYSPNAPEGERFTFQQYPLEVHASIVTSEKDNQEERHAAMWVENNFVETVRGQQFALDLKPDNVRWARAKLKDKFWAWNPRLNLGSSFTNTSFYPSLGMSLFSYGRTDRDMDWKFLGFSLGGDSNNFFVDATPFEWNVGNRIPLVENIFVGPNISYGVSLEDENKSNLSYGMKFSVPF